MQRIRRIDEASAPAVTQDLLGQVRAQMGGVPNILATMANSPAALAAYLGFAGALGDGVLPAALREQVALTVAGVNNCDYCASVHTVLGDKNGLDAEELAANLQGKSSDKKTSIALSFVRRVVVDRGAIRDIDLRELQAAGFSHEEVVELIAHTALNIFTNYFNHIAATEIDFPHVDTASAAA